jgi:hypothetical protein
MWKIDAELYLNVAIKLIRIWAKKECQGKNMASTSIILLAVWLGLNAAFIVVRLFATANCVANDAPDFAGYPRLVS